MKLRFYILSGAFCLMAVGIICTDDANAKSGPGSNIIPVEMLLVDTPPPAPRRIAEPGINPKDTTTSVNPVMMEPVNNNPAQTVNPE